MIRYFILSLCSFGPGTAGVGTQPHVSSRPGMDHPMVSKIMSVKLSSAWLHGSPHGEQDNECSVKLGVDCNLAAYPDLFPSPRPGNEARPPAVWVKSSSHGERSWRRVPGIHSRVATRW